MSAAYENNAPCFLRQRALFLIFNGCAFKRILHSTNVFTGFSDVIHSKYTFQIASDSVLVSNPNITYKEKYGKISFSDDDEYGYKLLASDGYGTYEFVKIDGAVYYRSFGDTFTNSTSADETEFTRLYRYENGYIEPKAPEIGMTADEVRNSTWDEPKEIDKTTTKYGVREQWVYSSRRYIYIWRTA